MLCRTFLVRNRSYGAAELLSSYAFRCHHFSTSPAAFPSEEAISAPSQVSHLKKSTENSDLIVNLFKQYGGVDQTQITDIISSVPKIISCNFDETLEPRLKIFQQLGLSGSDLVKLVKRNSTLFTTNQVKQMLPNIIYLKKLLGGSDEKVVKAIIRCSWLLAPYAIKSLTPNLLLLENYGLSNEIVEKLLIQYPRELLQKPKWLQDILHRVEGELGIPRDSNMFLFGIIALTRVSKPNLEMKFEIFRSFGWADSDIYTMARRQPMCFTISKDRIRKMLDFYMKELRFTPNYLASHPSLLMYSLEKRVKPRNHVLTILKEHKLVGSDMQLYSVVHMPELKFLQKYVLRFKDEVPHLYETYTNSFKLL